MKENAMSKKQQSKPLIDMDEFERRERKAKQQARTGNTRNNLLMISGVIAIAIIVLIAAVIINAMRAVEAEKEEVKDAAYEYCMATANTGMGNEDLFCENYVDRVVSDQYYDQALDCYNIYYKELHNISKEFNDCMTEIVFR